MWYQHKVTHAQSFIKLPNLSNHIISILSHSDELIIHPNEITGVWKNDGPSTAQYIRKLVFVHIIIYIYIYIYIWLSHETMVCAVCLSILFWTHRRALQNINICEWSSDAIWRCGPGPCITNVIATCRKNFSQWESSFLWKLRYHWLKFLRRVAKTLVIQGPGSHNRTLGIGLFPNKPLSECMLIRYQWNLL